MNKLLRTISYLCTTISLIAPLTAAAVPANPRLHPVIQPDGSIVQTRLRGDEHSHFIVNEAGLPIGRAADGYFYYYDSDANERPVLTGQRVGDPADEARERLFISSLDLSRLERAFNREREENARKRVRRNLPPQVAGFPCTGSPRGLVLLIEYSDVAFTTPDANDAFSRMLNEEGYSELGAWGSARDWFIANSGGRFSPQFDVVGPITLTHPRAYYGANKGGDDVRPEMMIIEACGLIADEIDFSLYDEDDDGFIDNVFAFYAGYGENLGAMVPAECVWPHSWDIVEATSVPYYFNGKRLNHYACTNEIDLSDTMDGIGTFVHEFSHVMGLPDLYATNYSFAFTPGTWSVMDEGPYNNNSRTPPLYSAFERLSLGWLEPVKISRPSNIKIPPISENQAYWIATENENEYFLLENRQQTGWDTYLPHHGMLVWHIDYNENIWHYNTVNDRKDHQYVDIVEADNHAHSDDIDGDPFPGSRNVTSFTDDTEPAMRSWGGKGCGVPLTDIFESNGYIYLKALGGKTVIDPVEAKDASEIGIDSFTANWEASEEPDCEYILSVYTSSLSPNGQTSITYVDGYEGLSISSENTSAKVTGLEPGGEYRYSVRVHDFGTNLQSMASNEITVSLLPPTFDFLRPRALEATELTSDGFTANWQALQDAESYSVTVVARTFGEPSSSQCGFSGGLSSLPQSWTTNSKLTYAAEDYCGEDTPSLRFNSEGQYLEMLAPEGYARGLRFWHRTVGTAPEATLEVYARVAGEWLSCRTLDLSATAADPSIEVAEEIIPYGADALRLTFHPAGKGSIAIDDVEFLWGGETTVVPLPSHTDIDAGTSTSLKVTGLEPSTVYFYTVTAHKDGVDSKISNEIRVVTAADSSVSAIGSANAAFHIDRAASTLRMYGLRAGEQVILDTVEGITLLYTKADATGSLTAKLPDFHGVCILRTATGMTLRFIL